MPNNRFPGHNLTVKQSGPWLAAVRVVETVEKLPGPREQTQQTMQGRAWRGVFRVRCDATFIDIRTSELVLSMQLPDVDSSEFRSA